MKNLCIETQCGGFQFLLILDLWGISFHAVVAFGLGKNLLFKSVLGHCAKKLLPNDELDWLYYLERCLTLFPLGKDTFYYIWTIYLSRLKKVVKCWEILFIAFITVYLSVNSFDKMMKKRGIFWQLLTCTAFEQHTWSTSHGCWVQQSSLFWGCWCENFGKFGRTVSMG